MSPLDIARRMLKQTKQPDAVSPPTALPAKPLLAVTASVPFTGESGSAQTIGLTTLRQKTLRYRAGCVDRNAAKELAKLESYLEACDRGEIELPARPSDEALREWYWLADERHRAKHPK